MGSSEAVLDEVLVQRLSVSVQLAQLVESNGLAEVGRSDEDSKPEQHDRCIYRT